MGSGPSSEVKNIQLEPTKQEESPTRRSKSSDQKQKASTEEEPSYKGGSPDLADDKDEKLQTLEKQLIESESQRLDLEDRVQMLEEQLGNANQRRLLTAEKSCDETMSVKTQQITRLEQSNTELREELNKWKQRHKRKVKSLTAQLTEQKLEANFQILELREETQRLLEENQKLEAQSNLNKPGTDSAGVGSNGETATTPGDRLKVILELSSQLEDQNRRVAKLEKQIQEKDQIVKELRVKLKNNAEYLKVRDGSDNVKSATLKTSLPGHLPNQPAPRTKNKDTSRTVDPIDALFGVDEEDEVDEVHSLSKLSTLLRGPPSTGDKALPVIRESYELKDESEPMEKAVRTVSGSSRDSGLGSAGKRESSKVNTTGDWLERSSSRASLESGISDSDLERDYPSASHSQISSAPPKIQNSGGQRLKKKSNSLKKRASVKDSTKPKPSLAFVEGSELPPSSHLLLSQQHSQGISPVHVS